MNSKSGPLFNSRNGLDNDIAKRKVKVYDVEKKELLGEFESMTLAANFTGVSVGRIGSYLRNKGRTKKTTNKLGKILCFR